MAGFLKKAASAGEVDHLLRRFEFMLLGAIMLAL